jgi:hypothetical protein
MSPGKVSPHIPSKNGRFTLAYFLQNRVAVLEIRRHAMRAKMMLVVGLVALFAVVSGYGQQNILKAKIDFPFKVEGKVLPPGEYVFTRDAQAMAFRVQGQGKEGAFAPIMSRMAAEIHTTAQDSHLTFEIGRASCRERV